jgi:hypothetical protein
METANDMLLTLMAENGITFVSSSFSNFTCNILVRLKNKKGGDAPLFSRRNIGFPSPVPVDLVDYYARYVCRAKRRNSSLNRFGCSQNGEWPPKG